MEEILVNINYLIREKLWGSIRVLADKVSNQIIPKNKILSKFRS